MVYGEPSEKSLSCPFCSRPVAAPEDIQARFGNVISGGRCPCGAVFVYDGSGHNMGDAYVDALTLACDGDMDLAWSLTPDEDYEIIEKTHNARKSKFMMRTNLKGKSPGYLFLKLKEGRGKSSP